MPRRLSLLLLLPAVLLIAACGGGSSTTSGGSTTAAGGSTEASADPFGQLRLVLGKFPYEPFYRQCLVDEVEEKLSAGELEELAELPAQQGRRVALRFALGAAPKCERQGEDPIIAHPSHVQVNLLRVGYSSTLEALGRREGLSRKQAKCLGATIAKLPDGKIVTLGNADEKQREEILVNVIEGCAK